MIQNNELIQAGKKQLAGLLSKTVAIIPLSICVSLTILYLFIVNSSTMNRLLNSDAVKSMVLITADFERVSLFRSTIVKNIKVRGVEAKESFLTIKQIEFDFSLADLWTGNIGINNLLIDNPKISLVTRNGKSNYDSLLGGSNEPAPAKKDDSKQTEPLTIELPFSTKVYTKFELKNLQFSYLNINEEKNIKDEIALSDFDLKFAFSTNSFSRLSTDPLALVGILKSIRSSLNVPRMPKVRLDSNGLYVSGKHNLKWNFSYEPKSQKSPFMTSMHSGSPGILIQQGKKSVTIDYLVKIKTEYNPEKDSLYLNELSFKLFNQLLINFSGIINSVQNPSKLNYNISHKETVFDLKPVYTTYKSFSGSNDLKFTGLFKLNSINLNGTQDIHNSSIDFSLDKFKLSTGDLRVDIPYFKTSSENKINLKKRNPIENLSLNVRGKVNRGTINIRTFIEEDKLGSIAKIKNLRLDPLTSTLESGKYNLEFSINGPFSKLRGQLFQEINDLCYYSGRAKSAKQSLVLNTPIEVSINQNSGNLMLFLPSLNFALLNQDDLGALEILLSLKLKQAASSTKVDLKIKELKLILEELMKTLHRSQRAQLQPVLKAFPYPIIMTMETSFAESRGIANIQNNIRFFLTEASKDDLLIESKFRLTPKETQLKKVELTAFQNAIQGTLKGSIKTGKRPSTKLDYNFSVNSDDKIEVIENGFLNGKMLLSGKVLTDSILSNIVVQNLSFESPGQFVMSNLNADIPINHKFDLKKIAVKENSVRGQADQVNVRNEKFNFYIEQFDYYFNQEQGMVSLLSKKGDTPGLGMNLKYSENVFEIKRLMANTMNGLISSRNTYFNLADGKPENMSYFFNLQVKDIDLKNLMRPELANAVEDGLIRADMQFSGKNTDKILENTAGYFSVYKIGEQFGKQALKVVQPDSSAIVDFAIDNSIIVRRIDMDLKDGLVYAKLVYNKGLLANIIGPEGEQLVQERIPITEFLQRAEKEANVYQVKTEQDVSSGEI